MSPLSQGAQFMLVGMSVVFGFLIVMVVVMNITASIFKNLPEEVKAKPSKRPKKVVNGDNESEIALAIAIAKSRR